MNVLMESKNIPLEDIYIDDEFNCRGEISHLSVRSLADSIEENGLLSPVTVINTPEYRLPVVGNKPYQLIAGFRRYKAHELLNRDAIPAFVSNKIQDQLEARIINIIENTEREQLNIFQEARSIKPLFDSGMSRQAIAKRLRKGDGWVQVRKMLISLPEELHPLYATGALTQASIRDLYSVFTRQGKTACIAAANIVVEKRAQGIVKPTIPNARKKETKRRATWGEMGKLQDYIYDTLGAGLATSALAFVQGNITLQELNEVIMQEASDAGVFTEGFDIDA